MIASTARLVTGLLLIALFVEALILAGHVVHYAFSGSWT